MLFLIRSFEFHSQFLTWQEARTFCANRNGGRLAEARTQEQFDAIFAFSVQKSFFFLGGSDLTNDGDWRWNSDNSPLDLQFFNQGEPNGGTTENCLEFRFPGFNDRPCNIPTAFLCESGATGEAPVCSD